MTEKPKATRTSRKGVPITASKGGRTYKRLVALTPEEGATLDKLLAHLGCSFGDWVAEHSAQQAAELGLL